MNYQAVRNDKNDSDCQLTDVVFSLFTYIAISLFFCRTICFCLMGFIMYDPSDIFSNVASVMFE